MGSMKIEKVIGREVLDSRGNPTVEAEVYLEGGTRGIGISPSGASTGSHEALELRDAEKRYFGKGVMKAVININTKINDVIVSKDADDLETIDKLMIEKDGTNDKSFLGANAILATSIACATAAAAEKKIPLYQLFMDIADGGALMPLPMMNILNGGVHAKNRLDFQEFMIMPVGAENISEGIRWCVEIYQCLKKLLEKDGLVTSVGDEGGFAPDISSAKKVLEYLMRATKEAGYEPYKDIAFTMDAAASELYNPDSGMYYFDGETKQLREEYEASIENKDALLTIPDTNKMAVQRSTDEMIALYEELCDNYPLISIEDPLNEEDWEGFAKMTKIFREKYKDKVMIVGDDLFVTNRARLKKGIEMKAANAILIKPNQIGSITETIETVKLAKQHGYKTIMSHRSGETEDTIIADLSVGLATGYIKTGAPCRGERTAKYNRLMRIEEELE